jgi:hypothetical protein
MIRIHKNHSPLRITIADTFARLIQEIHECCSREVPELYGVSLLHFTALLMNETTVRTLYFGTGYGTRIIEDFDTKPQQVFIDLPHIRRKHFSYKGHRVLITSTKQEVHAQQVFTFKNSDSEGWMDVIKSVYKPIIAEKIFKVVRIVNELNEIIYAAGPAHQETWTAFLATYREYLGSPTTYHVESFYNSNAKRYVEVEEFCLEMYSNHLF